jgi:flagellar basal-body rod modification protein FlgD
MSQIPSLTNRNPSAGQSQSASIDGLDMDHFLKLMIAELQNQDPLNPLENSELLQQISQIREVGATESLTDTLEAVLLGQNVSSATNLIGKSVSGIDDLGANIDGIVDRVTIIDGTPKLHIGSKSVKLSNVSEVQQSAAE